MHWDFALILLLLAAALPWFGRRRIRLLLDLPDTTSADRLALYASTIAFQWLITALILWRAFARGLSAPLLGLAIPRPGLAVAVGAVLSCAVFANQVFSIRKLASDPAEALRPLAKIALRIFPRNIPEWLAFLALTATVSLCEEIIYRGFVQRILQNWLWGSVLLGVLGSAALFALAHSYQGARGIAATFVVGVVFSAIVVWTASLVPAMMAHFVADSSAAMITRRLRPVAVTNDNSEETSGF
ncbi:MAG TPA: type II CAAX endopeptidase family protein [Candidatus Acidoferrales bacterium]|nr:type II CAAX endopeptidase family protein [Candidatus Acidoferrales bacterium]